MSILIKDGIIVTSEKCFNGDIRIENGKIIEIGKLTLAAGEEIIDAKGKYVLPGGVDVHTHLDLDTGTMRTADDFYSGSRAAIAGGTTAIVDFATQSKGGTLKEAVGEWKEKAENSFCDYGFHMAIVDWNDAVSDEMQDMIEEGISSFKLYMAYKGNLQVDDGVIYSALLRGKEVGGLIGFHCENGDLVDVMSKELITQGKTTPYYHPKSRPDKVEEEAIFRLCEIATLADAPIWVVHLSTEKGLRVIDEFKKSGLSITTETCPQYLLLEDSLYGEETSESFEAAKYVISPPLRKQEDIAALWQGLQDGSIDFVSTDHCSFNLKDQKEVGREDFRKIPNGGPGLEHRVILLYNFGVVENKISICKLVDIISETPSKLLGLESKGSIAVGKDGDLVILNPAGSTVISASTQVQNVDYTPYEGMKLSGKIESVLLRGELIYKDGTFLNEQPSGSFQKRSIGKH